MFSTHAKFSASTPRVFGGWKIFQSKSRSELNSSIFKNSKFSQHKFFTTHAWTHITSPYRASDFLSNPSLKQNASGQFTILNPDYVLNDFDTLARHYKAFGKKNREAASTRNLKDLIVFDERRTAKQLVSVVAATELEIKDDKHFISVCESLDQKVLPFIKERKEKFAAQLKQTEFSIIEKIKYCKVNGITDDTVMKQYFNIYNTILNRKNTTFTKKEAEEIAIQILVNDKKRELIKASVYEVVVDVVTREIEKQNLIALDKLAHSNRQQIMVLEQYPANQRFTQFIAGGPASGKSTLAKHFMKEIKEAYGISLHKTALISTDRSRLRLLNDPSLGKDIILRGLYTQDESRMLTEMSFELIGTKLKERGVGPHVIMETVSPLTEEIDVGLTGNSKVKISVTSCDPVVSVEGNFKRFQATGERLPPVCAVLGGHQLISNEIPKLARHYVGQEVLMMIQDTDQMRKEEGHSGLIAAFYCRNNKMIVHDIPRLLDFIKKSHLNPLATSSDKIFPSPKKVALNKLIKECFELFGDKEVIFTDPTVVNMDYNNAEQHAYATYNKEKGFAILNNEVFEKITSQSKEVKEIIDYLKKQIIQSTVSNSTMQSFKQ